MTGLPDKVREDGVIVESHKAMDAARTLLQYVGEDPERDGLQETPKRYVKALREITAGYHVKEPGELLKTFDNDAASHDMVVVRDIPFHSMCEHHVLPFFGNAHIAYIPGERIVGLSKFARVVDAYARRLQVQERLTHQIAEAIQTHVKPVGVLVVVQGVHSCMSMRGVQKLGATTVTSAVRGVFLDKPEARAEGMSLLLEGTR